LLSSLGSVRTPRFKKDSLWYSEDLDAIPERDVGRVCILQGPVAVRYSTVANEPVGDILDGMQHGVISSLVTSGGTSSAVGSTAAPLFHRKLLDVLGGTKPSEEAQWTSLQPEQSATEIHLLSEVSTHLLDALRQLLVSVDPTCAWEDGEPTWLTALLWCDTVVDGSVWANNPLHTVLDKQSGSYCVVLTRGTSGAVIEIRIYETAGDSPGCEADLKEDALRISVAAATEQQLKVTVWQLRPATTELQQLNHALEIPMEFNASNVVPLSASEGYIKQLQRLYECMWLGDEAQCGADSQGTKFAQNFTISAPDVQAFGEAANICVRGSTGNPHVQVPIDFATVCAWKPLMAALLSPIVSANLLNLVHLSHGYTVLAAPCDDVLRVDDDVHTAVEIKAITALPTGREVVTIALLTRNGEATPHLKITSKFFIREVDTKMSKSTRTGACFRHSDEEYTLRADETTIDLLKSRPWLQLQRQISVGDVLSVKTSVQKTYDADNTTIAKLRVSGVISQQNKNGVSKLKPGSDRSDGESKSSLSEGEHEELNICVLGRIEFTASELVDDPVSAFFERLEARDDSANGTRLFDNGGHNLLKVPVKVSVPLSAVPYAVASRDLNPIHRCPFAASLAHLPSGRPIMHGMWTQAQARKILLTYLAASTLSAAGVSAERLMRRFEAKFEGMVGLGAELLVQLKMIGTTRDGWNIVLVEVVDAETLVTVMSARAETAQPANHFVFTGQGSAEPGMGMAEYARNPIVKEVWDRGDAHLRKTFGFSILDIVRDNPTEKTVYFGGKQGLAIQRNYQKLSRDNERGEPVALIPEIDDNTQSFTFRAEEGLLFATQFSQPALVLLEKATFDQLEAAGLVPSDAIFAGHSLGEYAGLSAFGKVLAVEALVELVFLRGMVMQRIVQRDSQGRSSYGMVAANCLRVGNGFNEQMLHKLVDTIEVSSSRLLQVVNLNVQERQYVVAGDSRNLDTLGNVMTELFRNPSLVAGLRIDTDDAESGEQKMDTLPMDALVTKALAASDLRWQACKTRKEPFMVPRGRATIPLPGIDVPFHSKQLLPGVPAFRRVLRGSFSKQRVAVAMPRLLGKYIPNVIAKPFAVHKKYVTEVWEETSSPDLRTLLDDDRMWQKPTPGNELVLPVTTHVVDVAYTLVVELLAYQFASPVQWIKTQHYVFGSTSVSRQIEIGPAPTLTNMAKHTLQSGKYGDVSKLQLLWMMKDADRDSVYSIMADAGPSATAFAEELLQEKQAAAAFTEVGTAAAVEGVVEVAAVASPRTITAVAAAPVPSVAAVVLADVPVTAKQSLSAILAVLFKKSLDAISDNTTIHQLANGKSALQNEVVGEVESEFGSSVEGTAEMPISQLASSFPAYKTLGPVTAALVAKCVADAMPGGFGPSHVKTYLKSEWGLGAGRTDAVLLIARVMAPAQRLASENDAKDWLDSVVTEYAKLNSVSVAKASLQVQAAGGGAATTTAVVDPRMAQKLGKLVSGQFELCKKYLDRDVEQHTATLKASAQAQSRSDLESSLLLWRNEHGEEYERGIHPKFNKQKVRIYDSYWNWVVLDAMELYNLMISTVEQSSLVINEVGRSASYRHSHFKSMLPWLNDSKSAEDNDSTSAATERPFLCNRATPELLAIVGHYVTRTVSNSADTHYAQAVQLLYQQLQVWLDQPPVHLAVRVQSDAHLLIACSNIMHVSPRCLNQRCRRLPSSRLVKSHTRKCRGLQ
jgi:fatty acid synthase subunit beta